MNNGMIGYGLLALVGAVLMAVGFLSGAYVVGFVGVLFVAAGFFVFVRRGQGTSARP